MTFEEAKKLKDYLDENDSGNNNYHIHAIHCPDVVQHHCVISTCNGIHQMVYLSKSAYIYLHGSRFI